MKGSPRWIALLGLVGLVCGQVDAQDGVVAGANVDRIDAELVDGVVHGEANYLVDTAERSELRFWVYSDKLSAPPSRVLPHELRAVFPIELDLQPTDIEIWVDHQAVEARIERIPDGEPGGRDAAGADYIVEVPSRSQVLVTLKFSYRVPMRRGRLGRGSDYFNLLAPWYPLLLDGEESRPPAVVRLQAPGLECFRPPESNLRYVPFLCAEELSVRSIREGGRALRIVSTTPLPSEHIAHDGLRLPAREHVALHDFTDVNLIEGIRSSLRRLPSSLTSTQEISLILTDSLTEFAGVAPGVVLLSDHAFQVIPNESSRGVHEHALTRHLAQHLVTDRCHRLDPREDWAWACDLRGTLMAEDPNEASIAEMISWAAFHPSVDQLLYAPQGPFPELYFGGPAEVDRYHEVPERTRRFESSGRRVLEVMRDTLREHPEQWSGFAERIRSMRGSVRGAALEFVPSAMLEGFISAAAVEVNYRIAAVRSTEEGDGFVHQVYVERVGGARQDPVDIRALDEDGHAVLVRLDTREARSTATVRTRAPLREIRLDPFNRIAQSPEIADDHPRADDSTRFPLRPPILQEFFLDVGTTEGIFVGGVDVALRRQYRTRNTVLLSAATNARSVGGGIRFVRGFGPMRDTNSRMGRFSVGADLQYMKPYIGGVGGIRLGTQLVVDWSTIRFFSDPAEGFRLRGRLQVSTTWQDDGTVGYTLIPELRFNRTIGLGLRTRLVLVGGASVVFGTPLDSERPGIGGRLFLRGYQSTEGIGVATVFGVAEVRFTPRVFSDLSVNLLNLAWLRNIQLVAFLGAATVIEPITGEGVSGGADVGVGARFLLDYAGIQPGVFAVDVALPYLRDPNTGLPPVTTSISFEQYY